MTQACSLNVSFVDVLSYWAKIVYLVTFLSLMDSRAVLHTWRTLRQGLVEYTLFCLLASEKVSYLGVSVLVLTVLTVSGILGPKETLANIADPTIMLYVGSFIISAAFGKVRLAQMLGKRGESLLAKISHNESVAVACDGGT